MAGRRRSARRTKEEESEVEEEALEEALENAGGKWRRGKERESLGTGVLAARALVHRCVRCVQSRHVEYPHFRSTCRTPTHVSGTRRYRSQYRLHGEGREIGAVLAMDDPSALCLNPPKLKEQRLIF